MKSLVTSIFFLWTFSLLLAQNKKPSEPKCKDSTQSTYYLDQELKDSVIQEHKKTIYYLIQRSWTVSYTHLTLPTTSRV